jgi:hypothetical protein
MKEKSYCRFADCGLERSTRDGVIPYTIMGSRPEHKLIVHAFKPVIIFKQTHFALIFNLDTAMGIYFLWILMVDIVDFFIIFDH